MSKSRSGAPKRVAAGLLAGALTVLGLGFAPSAGATTDVKTDRYAGTTRYGTAAAIAGQSDFDGADTAILATGENFPDALAAAGIAGHNGPAPIILTQSGTYTQAARDALNEFTSVADVIIVGGTAAISSSVEQAVKDDGFNVTRVAGQNRFGTAAAIATTIGGANIGTVDGKKTALIANGLNYPDALAGGTVAYAAGLPILLVTPSSVPSETSSAISGLGIQHAIILGGTAAVGDSVAASLKTSTGSDPERVAGTNRFGTAAAVGEWANDNLNWAPAEVELASGVNFPDALAGGPLGGERHAPILLLASAPKETTDFATAHGATIAKVNCLGGTAACAEADLQTVATATKGAANATGTDLPELAQATIKSTRTAAQAAPGAINQEGTVVRFTFDEPVTGALPDSNEFWVYETDTDNWTEGDYAEVVTGDNKSVDVLFDPSSSCGGTCSGLNDPAEANNLVVATVTRGAVTDGTGKINPEGDAGITTGAQNTAAAGKTSAPDVQSAQNFRQALNTGNTAVDVTFDQPAFVQSASDFALELTDNTEVLCSGSTDTSVAAGGTSAGGSGTATLTIVCGPDGGNGSNFSPATAGTGGANVARVVVEEGAVSRTSGNANPNPLETADVSNSGNGSGPDLVSALFSPDAVANADVVAYIFDEPIQTPPLANAGNTCGPNAGDLSFSYNVYYTDGSQDDGGCVQRAPNNDSIVVAGFADHFLDNAVGVSVDDGAVTGFKAAPNDMNRRDEVGVAPIAGAGSTTGATGSPDLIKVEIQPYTDVFGVPQGRAIFTFDEDVPDSWALASGVDREPGSFHLYDSDGEQLNCNNFETQTGATRASDREVICTSWQQDDSGDPATSDMVRNAKIGTVEDSAVEDADGHWNPEGAEVTTARA